MKNKNIYAFFGVDGAGKTTTISEVKKELEKQGKKVEIFLMGRAGNHRLPFIKKFMRIKARYLKKKKGLDPKKDALLVDIYRKRGLLFMLVYYVDLWLRFFEIKKLAKEKVVLTDRFFYDGLALTKEVYLPLFRKITPKVKSFFLHAPPEVILKRKKEATPKNMKDYKKRVEENFSDYFDIVFINTSEELKKVTSIIVKEINNESF